VTTELYWLTLTILMTALFWIPYVLDRPFVRGFKPFLLEAHPETGTRHSEWAQRAMRAHHNAVENLVIFAPAIGIAHALNISSPATRAAAIVYFFARLAHFVVYTAGIPLTRTLAFTIGWAAQMVIIASILRWI